MNSNTETLIEALKILSNDIESDDGVANACIFEAAEKIEELRAENERLRIGAETASGLLSVYNDAVQRQSTEAREAMRILQQALTDTNVAQQTEKNHGILD